MVENNVILYTDLTRFISDHTGWVTETNPLIIRARMLKTQWGVELSVKKGKESRSVVKVVGTRVDAEKMAKSMQTRFRKSLKHVA